MKYFLTSYSAIGIVVLMSTATVTESAGRYVAHVSYDQREIAKAAGFRWDPTRREWYTRDAAVADKLRLSSEELAASVEADRQAKAASIEASRASDAAVEIPCPEGLAYLPFQRAGIAYALARPNVLIGDAMGLGKTVQSIGVINADPTLRKILVLCPASLRLNWRRELSKWLIEERSIAIAQGDSCPLEFDILVCNYDIAARHTERLRSVAWDLIIADEAHYLKNPDAKRTVAVLGKPAKKGKDPVPAIPARRKLLLTGTPIPNRPIEGWPLFNALGVFQSFWGYAKRYCAAYESRYGWDLSGASHLDELQDKLRASVMVRRLKEDVLTELPPKRRQVIEIPANGAQGAVDTENRAYEAHEERLIALRAQAELAKASDNEDDYAAAVARLREAAQVAFAEMSKARHATAVAMIPHAIEHVTDALEGGGKVVLFAHHHDIIDAIVAAFPGCAKLDGRDSMTDRDAAVTRFQTDPTCTLFVGGIQAAGVGLTLTASAHVIFAELDWVPGNVTQAEDRTHRIGQRASVLVQHLVLEGSLGARMAHVLVAKQAVIDAALDRVHEAEPIVPARDRRLAATENATRKSLDADAQKMTPERIAAIHQGLRVLAGMCDGAQELDGAGFSKIDVMIGHSLAEAVRLTSRQAALGAKLVNKYRRQLPAELVATAKGDA